MQPADDGIVIDVRVVPRSGRSGIAGWREDALLVRLNAAPVDGAANEELIAIVARAMHVPKRNVTITSGERSRTKRLRISGIDLGTALTCLPPR